MTDQRSDNDVLDLDTEQEIEGDEQQLDQDEAGEQPEPEEDVLVFGDEEAAPPEPETDLIKHLRKENRRLAQEAASARRQPQAEEPIVIGDRPTMEGCDYDEDRFYAELDAFEERKTAKAEQDRRVEHGRTEQERQWQQVQTNYVEKKRALPFADKETAEQAAFETLNEVQQAVIAKVADNPALVIYAAGKNGAHLARLAAIEDPLKLAREIGKMEATMTVKKRSTAPQPDTAVRGSTVNMGGVDKRMQELERTAARTGDRSEIAKYKRDQQQRDRARK